MTIYQEVTDYLLKSDHPRAKQYVKNEIIKMKIVKSYSAWINDHNIKHSLKELSIHIDYCLDTPELINKL